MKSLHLVAPDGSMRSTWPLTAGAPFTIGAQGNWCLGRGLLLPVHALVYFDGRTPLVASASQEWPVHLDGRPLPTSWTPLERSCRLTMGPIAIHYVSGDIDPERAAPTAKRRPRAREDLVLALRRRAPFLAGAAMGLAFALALALSLRTTSAHAKRPPAAAPAPRPALSPASGAAGMGNPAAMGTAPRPRGVVVHPVAHPPATPLARGAKSQERLAADAFHGGDRRRAAALYRELAAQFPENDAFATIAHQLDGK